MHATLDMRSQRNRTWQERLAARVNARLARSGRMVVARIHGGGLGDTFCLTSVMREIHRRYGWRFVVVTRFPELFRHHPLVDRLYAYTELGFLHRRAIKWMLRHCTESGPDSRVARFEYAPGRMPSRDEFLRDHRRRISLAQLHSEHWGLGLDYANLRNDVHFGADEIVQLANALPAATPYALIKPTANSRWTPNKDWSHERFQDVVDAFPRVTWVQTGERDEPPLRGVIDWRGRSSLRELLYIVSRARLVLGPEGFLNHAASAFDVPSIVVASGYAHPELALYASTIAVVRSPQVPCAPCWLREPCPVPGKPCTGDITVHEVASAVNAVLASPIVREPQSVIL